MTYINIFVMYFTAFFEAGMMFVLLENFSKRRNFRFDFTYLLLTVICSILIAFSNSIFNFGSLNVLFTFAVFFLLSLFYRSSLLFRIFISILCVSIIGICEIFVLFLISTIFSMTTEEIILSQSMQFMGIIVSKLLTYAIITIICRLFKKMKYVNSGTYWLMIFMVFAHSLLSVFLIFRLSYEVDNNSYAQLALIYSLGLMLITFIILKLYDKNIEQSKVIFSQERYQHQLKAQEKYIGEITLAQTKLRKIRHDINNHLIIIEELFRKGQNEDGINYVRSLSNGLNSDRTMVYSGNIALDAILNSKLTLAQSKKINVKYKVNISNEFPMNSTDISIVFGNALDNAIEACERLDSEKKEINLVISNLNMNTCFVKIINSYDNHHSVINKTSKKDKANHGFGIDNINDVLKKYDTKAQFFHTDTEYEFGFVIISK